LIETLKLKFYVVFKCTHILDFSLKLIVLATLVDFPTHDSIQVIIRPEGFIVSSKDGLKKHSQL